MRGRKPREQQGAVADLRERDGSSFAGDSSAGMVASLGSDSPDAGCGSAQTLAARRSVDLSSLFVMPDLGASGVVGGRRVDDPLAGTRVPGSHGTQAAGNPSAGGIDPLPGTDPFGRTGASFHASRRSDRMPGGAGAGLERESLPERPSPAADQAFPGVRWHPRNPEARVRPLGTRRVLLSDGTQISFTNAAALDDADT
ncbi:MAG: hypothetical protein J0H67_19840 [Rhodospirillales bacterium]|nr:hypothetical protein [Rhodospirillales bacterium]